MANPQLRQVCADIIRQVGNPVGADAIEFAERLEYGDPVPADEYAEALAAESQRADDAEAERNEAQEELKRHRAALKNLEKAIVRWDDERDDLALLNAWDEYRSR